MLGWFRSTPAPKACPENPGNGPTLRCAFVNAEGSGEEYADVLQLLAVVMREAGHLVQVKKSWLEVDEEFIIIPQVSTFQPLWPSGFRTCSTIEVRHSDRIPEGIFEYQHSTGDGLCSSFTKGFQTWMEIDFAVLKDAVGRHAEKCLALEMTFPAKNGNPPHFRRTLLGPVSWSRAEPPPEPSSPEEHSPFCSCCLFTALSQHLKEHLGSPQFYALRFFATRDQDGNALADCRINGLDWEPGKQALIDYVGRWPGQGFEFRKQYGVIQSVEGPSEVPQDEAS